MLMSMREYPTLRLNNISIKGTSILLLFYISQSQKYR